MSTQGDVISTFACTYGDGSGWTALQHSQMFGGKLYWTNNYGDKGIFCLDPETMLITESRANIGAY
jgi:hypothetical protein